MKAIRIALPAAVAAISVLGLAQTPAPQQKQVFVQDGGVRQTLESIFIPPLSNAPFTCILHTEWAQAMADGGAVTVVNQRRIARQSSGRYYEERWVLVPKNGPYQSTMSHIQIADPIAHTAYTCAMGRKVCVLENWHGQVTVSYKPTAPVIGPLPGGAGTVSEEALGNNVSENVNTVGTRIIKTLNPWVVGNDKNITSTREFWFAPSLGINLISKVSDPRFGSQTFTVTDLVLGEPDPQLFETPKGFTVRDERPAVAAE